MRVPVACSVLVLIIACGGAKRDAVNPSDTASLESAGLSGASEAATASSASSDSTGRDSHHATASESSSPPPSSGSSSAPAALHPSAGATGSLDGKPFLPKLAQVDGPPQKDGRIVVTLHEGDDCVAPEHGDASMILLIPWQNGYVVDLGSLRRAKPGDKGEAAFARLGSDKKRHVSKTFRPTGRLTVVSTPTDTTSGRLKVDLSSGDYILAGEIDVKACEFR